MKKLQSTLPERGGLSERGKDLYFAYAMLLPAILVFLIVIFLPIVKGIAASFCDYTIQNPHLIIGADFVVSGGHFYDQSSYLLPCRPRLK